MGLDLSNFNWQYFALRMAILVIAITVHEFAHAITADKLGDHTPRTQGRISLLPPDHLDPVGTVMMVLSSLVGFGIGWGKPVQTNPGNFRSPRRDQSIVAIAGPISNIIQAIIFALIIRFALSSEPSSAVQMFLFFGVSINLSLAFFNLIPIFPLDGWWIMQAILPHELSRRYYNWMITYGQMLFIGLIIFERQLHIISIIVVPPVMASLALLLPGFGAAF